MNLYEQTNHWRLPVSALRLSFEEMVLDGRNGNEGTALFLGSRRDGVANITRVLALRGVGVQKKPRLLIIRAEVMNEVADLMSDQKLSLIGQIHSHGRFFGVNLSDTDHTYGVRAPYFLSIVAPDYARDPNTSLQQCGVHIFEPGSGFQRIYEPELSRKITVTDETAELLVLNAGGAS